METTRLLKGPAIDMINSEIRFRQGIIDNEMEKPHKDRDNAMIDYNMGIIEGLRWAVTFFQIEENRKNA